MVIKNILNYNKNISIVKKTRKLLLIHIYAMVMVNIIVHNGNKNICTVNIVTKYFHYYYYIFTIKYYY